MFENDLHRRTLLKTMLGGLSALPLVGLPGVSFAQASTIRIALSAPPTTVDPHLQSNAPNNALSAHIFDSVVTNDPQSKSVPGLALSWKPVDDTHWEFELRPGVKFSDGSPLTIEDIAVSFNRATVIESVASFRTYTKSIKAITGSGTKLLVETKTPDPMLPNSMSRIRIISAKFKDVPSSDFNNGKAAIGTGPFLLESYVPGNKVVLKRNDAYWGEKLPFERVELQVISDDAARLAALLSGGVDLIEEMPYNGIQRIMSADKFQLIRGVSSRVVFISLNQHADISPFLKTKSGQPLDKNPLKDVRVRQALSMAINREGIVNQIMEGNATAASQYLPKGAPGTSDKIDIEKYDTAGAKALLAQAGYPDGFQLTLHGPNDRYINDAKVVQAVAQMFTRIGVQTAVEVMPWSVFSARNSSGEFAASLGAWGVNTGETSNPISALSATYSKEKGLGASNAGRYSNPQVDDMLAKALATLDEEKRNAQLADICTIIFNDRGLLPLHHEAVLVASRKGVNYVTRADQYTMAMGVRLG